MHFLAVITPGPDFTLVMRNALAHDRRIVLLTALGIATGIWVHVGYCMLGLAVLLSQSPLLFKGLRLLGGAYLVYMGISALRAKTAAPQNGVEAPPPETLKPWAAWRMGFLCNILNPKVTLFILGLFTIVLAPDAPKSWQLAFGLEMSSATFLWFAFVGLTIGNPAVKNRLGRFQGVMVKVMGAALVLLGLALALRG
jgi:RhtB (resistance to homoserine/threonine) family protein